jgi:hypothetical protein
MKKNIAICASGLWPTYFFGSFSRKKIPAQLEEDLLPPARVPDRQDEQLLGVVVAHEGPVDPPDEAQRHDEGRGEMGEADVAEDELVRGLGDHHRRRRDGR